MKHPRSPAALAPWPRWSRWLVTLIVLAGVGGLIWSQLPKQAYPTDLTRIGAARPALVLVQDPQSAAGLAIMEMMDAIRGDYPDVEFLVAHLGLPDGQDFARRHAVGDGVVVLFSAAGARAATLPHPRSADELRAALDQMLGY